MGKKLKSWIANRLYQYNCVWSFIFFNAERFAYNLPDNDVLDRYNLIDTVISISAGAHDHKACLWFFFEKNPSDLGLGKDGFQ